MTQPLDDKPFMTISNKRTLQFGIIGIVLVVLLIGTCTWTGARKGAIRRENQLEAQYRANQNELSSYIAGAREQFSAVLTQTAALERILTEAVKGRYEQNGTPQGGLINVLREAYPNLGDLGAYDRIVDYIQSKREAYKNVQNKLLDMIQDYENYLSESITRGWALGGYPSRGLEARVGDKVYKGSEALEQMKQIVLTREAQKAYESGEDTPLDFSDPNVTTSTTAG